ncbi:MAG: hypothetical protein A3E98_03145 [Candidatus Doudnabacteria bacterium RIFCSPHIGHO2_12_FULL_48_11]|uniref:Uncharacterized protein n=1 Tax=Candidatus Doudnabacteria bacterium RIFCSPHIGHO2_01_FULL_46_24 TaxID=1817825 RepID=A0A1F5NW04_9BACT|nr:MAG: hypothetical protein A2720_03275 [Candidatus Doudnabacteria bacterium RIFCSPHIGHO2_01_FULL_46_24]OGE96035.1 MAG: hypothetical protein A3E98_03145 [Candidatus Doudnabacteria bacterium RIFCSPHIGHO2_12_FULL_48_11]
MQVQPTQQGDIASRTTSEAVIPSVRGEFYNYTAVFTPARPLAYLMKCKANKDRPLHFAEDHVDELDLVVVFENSVRLLSPNTPPAIELLGDLVTRENLRNTWIAPVEITPEVFNLIRQQKDRAALKLICRASASISRASYALLQQGVIVAVSTESRKYGLLHVKEVSPASVKIDACHILL